MFSQDNDRSTLIQQILSAKSQDEVKRVIDTSLKTTRPDPVIRSFVDRVLSDILQSDPMNQSAEQWSNLKMAKIYFNRIRQGFVGHAY